MDIKNQQLLQSSELNTSLSCELSNKYSSECCSLNQGKRLCGKYPRSFNENTYIWMKSLEQIKCFQKRSDLDNQNKHTCYKLDSTCKLSAGYHEYKAAGEYWNIYPKTDYTYSLFSPHRREIVPGIVAMPNMSRKCLKTYKKGKNYNFFINNETNIEIKQKYINLYKENFNLIEQNYVRSKNYGPISVPHNNKKLAILDNLLKMLQLAYAFGSMILFVDTLILKSLKFADFLKILYMLMLMTFIPMVSLTVWNIFEDSSQRGCSRIWKIHSTTFAHLKPFIDNIISKELTSIKWSLSTMSYVAMWVVHGNDSSKTSKTGKQAQINNRFQRIDEIAKHASKQRNKLKTTVRNAEYFETLYVLDEKYNRLMNRISKIEIILNKFNYKIIQGIDLKIKNSFETISKENKVALAEFLFLNSDQMMDKQLSELSNRYNATLLKKFMLKWKTEKQRVIASHGFGEYQIRKIVNEMLSTYDADKIGKADYALESSGGQIISTRCTETYHIKSAQVSILGIPIMNPSNTPRVAISASVFPGECWAFQGFPGFLMVKLNVRIYVSGFTLEHISKHLAPYGRIDSAPKKFSVWDLKSEDDSYPMILGEYEYDEGGPALQYFQVKTNSNRKTDIVELKVESNHGNRNFTCVYRFRVHGNPFKMEPV